jgi:hypothetical protein
VSHAASQSRRSAGETPSDRSLRGERRRSDGKASSDAAFIPRRACGLPWLGRSLGLCRSLLPLAFDLEKSSGMVGARRLARSEQVALVQHQAALVAYGPAVCLRFRVAAHSDAHCSAWSAPSARHDHRGEPPGSLTEAQLRSIVFTGKFDVLFGSIRMTKSDLELLTRAHELFLTVLADGMPPHS